MHGFLPAGGHRPIARGLRPAAEYFIKGTCGCGIVGTRSLSSLKREHGAFSAWSFSSSSPDAASGGLRLVAVDRRGTCGFGIVGTRSFSSMKRGHTFSSASFSSSDTSYDGADGACKQDGEDAGPKRVWEQDMPAEEFELLRSILAAPSPVGLEEALVSVVQGSLGNDIPDSWTWHRFKGHAGAVLDTDPSEEGRSKPCIMIVGHSDKIRLQVRKIASDGKIYIDSDSHLPLTLLGNEVVIYSEDLDEPGRYRSLKGATVEALGAIHFAEASLRTGAKGIKPESLYLELGLHGEGRADQVKNLGIRVGDSILMDRPITRGVGPRSFQGAYLDNGLGCFVACQAARLLAQKPQVLDNVRVLFTLATHEEIGRFGSRVLAREFSPDVLMAVDVNHDYNSAPGVGSKNFPDIAMGGGPTITRGSVVAPYLNSTIQQAAKRAEIPIQIDTAGRDTGTDAMAGVLSAIDCACCSVGICIRNMHTISETGVTDDVIACYHLVVETVTEIASTSREDWVYHPNLSKARQVGPNTPY